MKLRVIIFGLIAMTSTTKSNTHLLNSSPSVKIVFDHKNELTVENLYEVTVLRDMRI